MIAAEAAERRRAMLRTAMGPAIAAALADPLVIEVMVNPDGALRLDRLDVGRCETDARLEPDQVERIIRLVASHARTEVHGESPIVSAELPPHGEGAGERFEGLLPPVSIGPCFAIRKPAARIYSLLDYVRDGIMSAEEARALSLGVVERRNILVAGGTSSGKTTLANALLAELAARDERVILIEDTRELQCAAPDTVALRTRAGAVSMADLVRSTLRLRPDRIIVGEVRGAEALDMLKAWNTGHPGGIATVHANGALAALYRLEQLVQEALPVVPRRLIAEAIDLIVFIEGRGTARRIGSLAAVDGLAGYAGLEDRVDFHEWRLLKGIALSTLLGVGSELSLGSDNSDLVRAVERSIQRDGARAGDQLVSRNLDVQPTLTIRPGWPVRAMIHKDLVLKPWKG